MSEELDYKDMPPAKYTIIHADARLTDAQRKELKMGGRHSGEIESGQPRQLSRQRGMTNF